MKQLDYSLRSLEAYLEDQWRYERFHDVVLIFEQAQSERTSFAGYVSSSHDEVPSHDKSYMKPSALLLTLQKAHSELQSTITTVIKEQGERLGLSDRQQEELLKKIAAVSIVPLSTVNQQGIQPNYQQHLQFLAYLNAQEEVLQHLIQIAGSKVDFIDTYFPLAIGQPQFPKVGQLHKIQVSIGTYEDRIARSVSYFVIGQDTLQLGIDGTATYEFTPNRKGRHTLPTKCIVTNPLTGEVRIGEGRYEFNVY